nr:MAG TPA: hypothetical protein [Caudoviricetes sp.]
MRSAADIQRVKPDRAGLRSSASVQNGVFMYRGKKHYIFVMFFTEMY